MLFFQETSKVVNKFSHKYKIKGCELFLSVHHWLNQLKNRLKRHGKFWKALKEKKKKKNENFFIVGSLIL